MSGVLIRTHGGVHEVDVRAMRSAERVVMFMARNIGWTEFSPYHLDGELLHIERKRGRAYPICAARSYPIWSGRERFGHYYEPTSEPYPWCPEKARWHYGEMDVCPNHAAQMALGITVPGVPVGGRWKP